jgi:hypothetical protein
VSQPRKPAPNPERTLGRFDGALLAGLLICSALVTVFLLVGRAYGLAPQAAATPPTSIPAQSETFTPLPTAIVAVAGTSEPTATPPVPTNTPEIVPTPRVEPLDLTGLFAGQRFTVHGQGVPGQTIALYDNDLLVGTRVVDTYGNWEIAITQGLPTGEHRLVVVAIGLDGGRSEVAPVGFTMLQAGPGESLPASSPTAADLATIAPTSNLPPTVTPTLEPSATPSLPPTKRPTEAPTTAALAVTEVEASPAISSPESPAGSPVPAVMPTAVMPSPISATAVPSATPELPTLAASPTSMQPTSPPTEIASTRVPPTEAAATSLPPTEVQPSPSPTLALTALGLLPTEARPAALPSITPLPPTATASPTSVPTDTPSPLPASPTPAPPPTQDGQGGAEGVLPQASPAALSAVPTAGSSASAAQASADQTGLSGWGEPGGSVTLLAEDGQVLATAPVGPDGRWTASPDPGALAAAGQITVQEYDPAGIIVAQTVLQTGSGSGTPLLPRTGASTVGRSARANGPALALLLGMALLLGGALFHQAGRMLRLLEAESGFADTPRVRHTNQKGTPSRRP